MIKVRMRVMDLEQYQFKYPWRKYQANVLAELDGHMHDDRLIL